MNINRRPIVLSAALYLKRKPEILMAITTFVLCLLLLALGGNFKLATIVALLTTGVYYLITKNLFLSLFSTFIVSAPFLLPAKQYEFEYASASEYVFPQWPNGIISSINLSISNLLEIFIILFFLIMVIRQIIHIRRHAPNLFANMFNLPLFRITFYCWLGYFGVSIYSSLYYSMFPYYSLYLLFENSKLIIGFIGIVYLFITNIKKVKFFYIVLLTMLIFQCIAGSLQFLTNFGTNSGLFTQDAEENIPFPRIEGVSYHANILAFIILILFILILPYINKHRGWIFNLTILLSGINIVLSQSRTAWLSIIVIIGYVLILLKHRVANVIFTFVKEKKFYYIVILSLLTFLIMLPRLQASSLFFGEEGGGALRAQMISEGLSILPDMPFTGFGLGTGVKIFFTKISESYATTFPLPIHFAFLQMALESGIPGAILFYLPILVFLVKYTHILKQLNRHSYVILLSSLCAILTILIHYCFQPAYGQLEFYLIGIALGIGILSPSSVDLESYL